MRDEKRVDGDEIVVAGVAATIVTAGVVVGITLLLRTTLPPPFGTWEEVAAAIPLSTTDRVRIRAYKQSGAGIVVLLAAFVLFPVLFRRRAVQRCLFRCCATNDDDDASTFASESGSSADTRTAMEPFREALAAMAEVKANLVSRELMVFASITGLAVVDVILDVTGAHVFIAHAQSTEPFGVTTALGPLGSRTILLIVLVGGTADFSTSVAPMSADVSKLRFERVARQYGPAILASTLLSLVHILSPLLNLVGPADVAEFVSAGVYFVTFVARLGVDAVIVMPSVRRVRSRVRFRRRARKQEQRYRVKPVRRRGGDTAPSPHSSVSGAAKAAAGTIAATASRTAGGTEDGSRADATSMPVVAGLMTANGPRGGHRSEFEHDMRNGMQLCMDLFGPNPRQPALSEVNVRVPTEWRGQPVTITHAMAAATGLLWELLDPLFVRAYATLVFSEVFHIVVTVLASETGYFSSEMGVVVSRCLITIGVPSYIMWSAKVTMFETLIAVLKTIQRKEVVTRVEQQRLFLRYVCHEVRVPLNTVALSVSEIQDSLHDGAARYANDQDEVRALRASQATISEVLTGMRLATASMKHVLDDVLLIEKIRSGQFTLEFSHFSLGSLISPVLRTFRGEADAAGVGLSVSWQALPPELRHGAFVGDRHRLAQVCANLLSNAIKFSPRGGRITTSVVVVQRTHPSRDGEATLSSGGGTVASSREGADGVIRRPPTDLTAAGEQREASSHASASSSQQSDARWARGRGGAQRAQVAREPHALLRYMVRDEGVGMSPTDLKRIFTPFTQIKSGKLQAGNGTGLGLSICRQIVELHGGVVGCWSEGEGRGAVFWFDVPLAIGKAEAAPAQPSGSGMAPETCDDDDGGDGGDDDGGDGDGDGGGGGAGLPVPLARASVLRAPSPRAQTHGGAHADGGRAGVVRRQTAPLEGPAGSDAQLRGIVDNQLRTAAHAFHNTALPSLDTFSQRNVLGTPPPRNEGPGHVAVGVDAALTRDALPRSSIRGPPTAAPFAGLRCIVVDDTRPNAVLLGRMVERLGAAAVALSGHGQKALEEMGVVGVGGGAPHVGKARPPREWEHDVVFMDKEMPVMDGHEATRILRRLGFPGPIIGVSGNAMGKDREAFEACGADAVVDKPVGKARLVEVVTSALSTRGRPVVQQGAVRVEASQKSSGSSAVRSPMSFPSSGRLTIRN